MTQLEDTSVSICIASYNMADTIETSLVSITESLPQNFEIVIVDESTDGSKKIIDDVASRSALEFKRVYNSVPLGVGHARNLAVCEATGDIVITHVDADDWYESRYFPALVELYLKTRERRGSDFFFSCPNMNISSRQFMKEHYLLSSLPIGANEREYRWRAHRNEDLIQLVVDDDVSGRIKLSDRKTIASRVKRTYSMQLGMYRIGYTTRRIMREDIIERSWPLYSQLFRVLILPLVWLQSLFVEPVCHAPIGGKTLSEAIAERTFDLEELRRAYDISGDLLIDDLVRDHSIVGSS
jgi:glycosyltransferase involved in cell wall biosynthesis